MNNTSLKKSHSVYSNFKLTLLCIITTITVTLLWVLIGIIASNILTGSYLYIILEIISACVLVELVLFSRFKR